nr:immunoglobulin light chain junction region [Homo sapiens]
ADYYCQAWDSS